MPRVTTSHARSLPLVRQSVLCVELEELAELELLKRTESEEEAALLNHAHLNLRKTRNPT